LVDAFLEITKGFLIPSGSVLVIFSASHLAWSGAAAYSKEWTVARQKIIRVLGGGVEVLHGFPLLQIGTADLSFLRSLIDLQLWHDQMGVSKGRDICVTRDNVYSHYFPKTEPVAKSEPGAGTPLAPEGPGTPLAPGCDPIILKMPVDLTTNEEGMFLSPGYKLLPSSLEPLAAEDELALLLDLVKELNEKFVLDLDDDIELMDKLLCDPQEEEEILRRFVVVGNSHASRLVCAMEDAGLDARLISASGWAEDPDICDNIVQMIKEEVELHGKDVILVYFLYDNEVYVVDHEDGEQTAPVKIPGSSKYHINGKLGVVDREKFKAIFNVSVPLLRAGGECPKILMSPLLRYMTSPCCKLQGHLTNYGGPEYALLLGEAVENLRQWIKDFTFGKKIRNFKVVCSNTAVGVDEENEEEMRKKTKALWTSDPVHLSPAGYEKLATAVCKALESGLTRPVTNQQKRTGQVENVPQSKRARWVEDDEVTVSRERGGGKGRGRGNFRGWRPRRGWFRGQRGGYRGKH
jgi:hypothetical protein